MEQEIVFLNFETIYSKKKDEYFFIVRYMLDDTVCQDFVSQETFDSLRTKKPIKLQKYKGTFIMNNRKTLILTDINPLKG